LAIFTADEANAALADIRPRLQRVVAAKGEFDRLQVRIEVLGLAMAGATRDNPDAQELRGLHERRNLLAEEISREITAVQRHGCVIKDLDRGLVDFYALNGDRLVFLCWQLGEEEVSHWHSLDGGFSSRQPLHPSELE
jgi:hypothetical protein